MKRLFIIAALALSALTLSAQESPIYLEQGTSSLSGFFSYSTNSLFRRSTGIMYNYYIQDGLALRANVRVGYNNDTTEDSSGATTYKTSYIDNNFRAGVGLQKSLIKSKRFNGYVATDVMAGIIGSKTKMGDNVNKDSTFEFGIRPAMGIEYHFVNNFFIGLEWGYDILFNSKKTDYRKVSNTIVDIADLSSASLRLGFNF